MGGAGIAAMLGGMAGSFADSAIRREAREQAQGFQTKMARANVLASALSNPTMTPQSKEQAWDMLQEVLQPAGGKGKGKSKSGGLDILGHVGRLIDRHGQQNQTPGRNQAGSAQATSSPQARPPGPGFTPTFYTPEQLYAKRVAATEASKNSQEQAQINQRLALGKQLGLSGIDLALFVEGKLQTTSIRRKAEMFQGPDGKVAQGYSEQGKFYLSDGTPLPNGYSPFHPETQHGFNLEDELRKEHPEWTPEHIAQTAEKLKTKPETIGQSLEAALLARQLMQFATQYNPKLLKDLSPIITKMLSKSGSVEASKLVKDLSEMPPGMPTDLQGNQIGTTVYRETGPTQTQRNRGQFARDAIQYIDRDVMPNLDRISKAGDLGPVRGSLMAMMAKHGLLNDPDFLGYMTNTELMKGAIASIHFGGRGIAEQFQGAIGYLLSPKQPEPVLRSNIEQFRDLLKIYAVSGGRSITQPTLPGENAGAPSSSGAAGAPITVKLSSGKTVTIQ